MANYFTAILGSGSLADFSLVPVNKGDASVYMRVSGVENFTLRPSEKIKAMIAPHSSPLSSSVATTFLKQTSPRTDTSNGYFFFQGGENNTQQDDTLGYHDLKLPREWENTEFDLYWLQTLGPIENYGTNLTGIYSYPHNIQPKEVTISGTLITNDTMKYKILLEGIENDDDPNYGSTPTDGPYAVRVDYRWPSGVSTPSGFSNYVYYDDSVLVSGINFNLPFYDPRDGFNSIPAVYNFNITHVSAGSNKPGSKPLTVTINHANLIDSNTYFNNLDEFVFSHAQKAGLKKVGTIDVPANTIDRKRISIGINDIAIQDNTYVKQGTYISRYYPVSFQIYTFSFRVKEYIPDYGDLDPYDLVKYSIEFNNNSWERISPLERTSEYENGILVPKLFVFDESFEETENRNVKFLNYGSPINLFRVKITFNLRDVEGAKFPPPEINDYRCVVFDKAQFLNL